VWTGSEMIVWGGFNSETQMFFNQDFLSANQDRVARR
jgi:hypothetical protein